MSIITKPSILKGVPAQFTLNKSQLLLNPLVAADSYFSDSQNWYRVNLVYKSAVGGQYEIVEFDATQTNPTGNFLISEKARDSFEILKVKIIDFDGGFLEIPRSSLNVTNFDISLTGSGSGSSGGTINSLTWTSDLNPEAYLGTSNSIQKLSGNGWNWNVVSNESVSGNAELEFVVTKTSGNFNHIVGFQFSPVNSSNAYSQVNLGIMVSGPSIRIHIAKGQENVNYTEYYSGVSSISEGDVLKLTLVGNVLTYYKNNTLVHSFNFTTDPNTQAWFSGITGPVKVGVTIFEQSHSVSNIVFKSL